MRKQTYAGKFFVLEGIDGCGGETQSNLLVERLKEAGVPATKLSYPDYRGPIGQLIHRYLREEYEFPKDVQLLLYLADFLKDKETIERLRAEGKMVVADRYASSTLAYQCFQGVSLERALSIVQLLELPVPDAILYLRITADTSIARKMKEKGGDLDRNESNRQFLAGLIGSYNRLSEENRFAPWHALNGEQPVENVAEDIWQIISPQLA